MIAADKYQRFFPMLMTAAGTVKAARVVILGVGVAGLQAIATAKRLGAVDRGFDVRPSVKEQIESLGGKFIEVPLRAPRKRRTRPKASAAMRAPMPASWLSAPAGRGRQARGAGRRRHQHRADPGREPRRTLITEDMVKSMKPGSVIVDIAAGKGPVSPDGGVGGNCPLSEADKTVVKHGVTIVGETNLGRAGGGRRVGAVRAQRARLPQAIVLTKEGTLKIDLEDDIVAACRVTQDGQVTNK